jgi:DNA recombination protein RmuC
VGPNSFLVEVHCKGKIKKRKEQSQNGNACPKNYRLHFFSIRLYFILSGSFSLYHDGEFSFGKVQEKKMGTIETKLYATMQWLIEQLSRHAEQAFAVIVFLFVLLFFFFFLRYLFLTYSLKEKLLSKQEIIEEQKTLLLRQTEELESLRYDLACKKTELEKEREGMQEKLRLLETNKEELLLQFKSLSQDVLKASSESFLQLAGSQFETHRQQAAHHFENKRKEVDEIVRPIGEVLKQFDLSLKDLERSRQTAYVGLYEQVKYLQQAQEKVRQEAQNLSKALRVPNTRGKWGEIQLRKVVELAGMVDACDFEEQVKGGSETEIQRPDMVVRLPGGRSIVVDAKTPLKAYLEAYEEENEQRYEQLLKEHARAIKAHIQSLGSKSYWQQFSPSPEFVILFLPAESFFSQALKYEVDLIEYAAKNHVIMATPTTLIALLRTVAYGWRQEAVEKNAEMIVDLATQLSDRFKKFLQHFDSLRRNLDGATHSYNQAINSFETRLLPCFRKFQNLAKKEEEPVASPLPLEKQTRMRIDTLTSN